MAYLAGIDEAGYGPNLGPFVMTLVVIHLPGKPRTDNLWSRWKKYVRRSHERDDGRLLVDDSKKVYSPAGGLGTLEPHVCPHLWREHWCNEEQTSLERYWQTFCALSEREPHSEPWYVANESRLPRTEDGAAALVRHRGCALGKESDAIQDVQSIVVFPKQFNALTEQYGSKGAVVQWAARKLLARLPEALVTDEIALLAVDRHGGRAHYHPLLQEAFPDCMVWIRDETATCSRYQVHRRSLPWSVSFEVEADQRHFAVALASMVSKYVREVFMEQFNAFWRGHLPDLKATAGYPTDARRFYEAIEPIRQKLGIAHDVLWRVR